jgi:Sortase domain
VGPAPAGSGSPGRPVRPADRPEPRRRDPGWRPVALGVLAALGLASGAGVLATGVGSAPALIAGSGSAEPAEPSEPAGEAPATAPAASIPGPGVFAAAPSAGAAPSGGAAAGTRPAAPEARRPDRPAGAPAFAVPAPAPPVEVEVPAIGVRSSLVDLQLDGTGALAAPDAYDVAGWFVEGPQPGQPGPAVIAGHVDSRDGPAVFYRLAELAEGDTVVVRREGAEPVRFTVTRVEQYPKDDFPTESVYGPVPGPELRLITCGGTFDRSARRYRDNVVVYASATPS